MNILAKFSDEEGRPYLRLVVRQVEAHLHLLLIARVAPDEVERREVLLCEFKALLGVVIVVTGA